MSEELLSKRATDFILHNTFINYCLYKDDRLFLKSYIHNNRIDLRFDETQYYCFMTGTHMKFVNAYTRQTADRSIDRMYMVYDVLMGEMQAAGYKGNILLAKVDNSKQIVMFISPGEQPICTPEELAQRLHERYLQSDDPYLKMGAEYMSSSFVGPYSGHENMHRAFWDVRALNDLIFFGVRGIVITEEYRRSTALTCDTCAISSNFRRFFNAVCTSTLQQALRQADVMIRDMIAPSYDMSCFSMLYVSCENMFTMLEICYPKIVHIDRRAESSFYTLEDYHTYLNEQLRAIFTQLRQTRRYSATMIMALSFINRNYTSDISLPRIAEYVYVNASSLSSEFNATMGESLSEYITSLRVEHAKRLLKHSPFCITEIAHRSGFSNVKYFREVFKRQTGYTPRGWRDA